MTTKPRKAVKTEGDSATEFPTDAYDAMAAAREETSAAAGAADGDKTTDESKQDRQPLADPRELEMIRLGPDNASPAMRLYRSNRTQLLAMQFDEKPADKYTQQLREAGWRWRQDDKVWAKKLDRDHRWSTQAEAEQLFRQIGSAIRTDLGLEPTQAIGR